MAMIEEEIEEQRKVPPKKLSARFKWLVWTRFAMMGILQTAIWLFIFAYVAAPSLSSNTLKQWKTSAAQECDRSQ